MDSWERPTDYLRIPNGCGSFPGFYSFGAVGGVVLKECHV